MDKVKTNKQKIDESHLGKLNRRIFKLIYEFNLEHSTEYNEIHILNAVKKYNKPSKNETSAISYQDFYSKDVSFLVIKILDALEEQTFTRKELSKFIDMNIETLTGIIPKLLKEGLVEVLGKRKCRITSNEVEQLSITKNGKQVLYNRDYVNEHNRILEAV